jgi:hypothetical protein
MPDSTLSSWNPPALAQWLESLPAVVDRIEKAMRPLAGVSYGIDHDRVRDLYTYLRQLHPDTALERARRVVLAEILWAMLRASAQHHPDTPMQCSDAVVGTGQDVGAGGTLDRRECAHKND